MQLDDLQRAIPCAHTFLQRNPEDQEMHQLMEEYKSEYDLSGYLINHEEQPYEARTTQHLSPRPSSNIALLKQQQPNLTYYYLHFNIRN